MVTILHFLAEFQLLITILLALPLVSVTGHCHWPVSLVTAIGQCHWSLPLVSVTGHCHWSVSLLATNRRHLHNIQAFVTSTVNGSCQCHCVAQSRLRVRVSHSLRLSDSVSVSDCRRRRSAAACVGVLLICTGYIVGRTVCCQCRICWPILYFRLYRSLRIESEENDGFCIRRHC